MPLLGEDDFWHEIFGNWIFGTEFCQRNFSTRRLDIGFYLEDFWHGFLTKRFLAQDFWKRDFWHAHAKSLTLSVCFLAGYKRHFNAIKIFEIL